MPDTANTTNSTAAAQIFIFPYFDPKEISWKRWEQRLRGAFKVYNVPQAMQVHNLLHYMGNATFDYVCNKLYPALPDSKNYNEIVDIVTQFYDPTPLEVMENYRFSKRYQEDGESVQEYLAALQKLAITCNFGDYQNTALRNQFVFGIRNQTIQSRLLETRGLTLESALTKAIAMELSFKDAAQLQSTKHDTAGVAKLTVSRRNGNKKNHVKQNNVTTTNTKRESCYRCGSEIHWANKCDKRNENCRFCGVKGHLEKMCLKKKNGNKKKGEINSINTAPANFKVMDIFKLNENANDENFREKFFVKLDVNNKTVKFEIDCGAAVTVIGEERCSKIFGDITNKLIPSELHLKTYCNTIIKVLGYMQNTVKYQGASYSLKMYVVPGDKEPLLGREWLRQIRLNWLEISHLSDSSTLISKIQSILVKYRSVTDEGIGEIKDMAARINIKEGSTPVFCKARTVPFAIQNLVDREIATLVDEGILEKVNTSDWATPVVPVVKANGRIRLCGDFKVTLNRVMNVDDHPLPTIDELFSNMAGGDKFTKIDVSQAYLHLPVHKDDRKYLTLNTHRGLYQCNRLIYGLANAPAIWQREMEKILQGIPGVSVFLDDIKLTAKDDTEHLERLDLVLSRLHQHNIKINKDKSSFMQNAIEYCGFLIDRDGIHKLDSKIEAIQKMRTPKTKTEVRAFLGLVNYYSRFLKNLSNMLQPINNLLRGTDDEIKWTSDCEKVFQEVKILIQDKQVLCHFNPSLPIVLATDASAYAVGAVLSHIFPDGSERPIQFASQTLTDVQRKYSQIDKEAYGIIYGVKKFFNYLYGRRFILQTDHQPLIQIFSPSKSIPLLSATRMQHYALYLQAFNYDIRYRNTKLHGNADAMSRLPTCSEKLTSQFDPPDVFEIQQIETMPTTAIDLAKQTSLDPSLLPLLQGLRNGVIIPKEQRFYINQDEFTLQSDCILRGVRVVIPSSLRKQVLNELHSAHFGISKMKMLARGYCWWPRIDADIESITSNCSECLKNANNPPKIAHTWETPTKPFQRIHIDYAGPVNGVYYFIVVDSYTKWPEIFIMKKITSSETIKLLRELFARFGIPVTVVSDNGSQFVSREFQHFLKMNGVVHKRSAPYHPATNGQAERYVQTLKKSLKAMKVEGSSIDAQLACFLLQYRKAPQGTTKKSPSMMLFGREIRSRLDLLLPVPESNTTESMETPRHVSINDSVIVRNYNSSTKWVKATVCQILGKLHYLVKLTDGTKWKRHINQIKVIRNQMSTKDISQPNDSVNFELLRYDPYDEPDEQEAARNERQVTSESEYSQSEYGFSPNSTGTSSESEAFLTPEPEVTIPELQTRRSNRPRKAVVRLNL